MSETTSKPYYQDEFVTLYHGDCFDITEWIEADILVTDPPYGMKYRRGYTSATRALDRQRVETIVNDANADVRDAALALWGQQRPALVFGTWRVDRPIGTRNLMVWDKGNSPGAGGMKFPWGSSHEEVYLLGSGWPLIVSGGRLKEGGKPARGPSVIRINGLVPGSHARPDHPTPKPIALMEHLILRCPPGIIADPFSGSGSTLIAAKNLRRQAIGVEVDERYCEVAARRLSQDALDFSGATS